jgi:hypothetical protein
MSPFFNSIGQIIVSGKFEHETKNNKVGNKSFGIIFIPQNFTFPFGMSNNQFFSPKNLVLG